MGGKRASAWAAAAALALIGAPGAQAVTNGAPDDGRHPYVGALVTHNGKDKKKRLICSGTLVSPTVFLTAAHCLLDEPAKLYASFDAFVGAPDVGPEVTLHPGTAVGHLAYQDSTAPGDTHDIGVLRLDPPVQGIAPASLPRPDQLGKLHSSGRLASTSLEIVGYGREGYDGRGFYGGGGRRFAFGAFGGLEAYKLLTDQTGTHGGSCNGDSGGPILLGGTRTVVAIISDGDPHCQTNGVNYRTDTDSARDFLDDFMPVPPPSNPHTREDEAEPVQEQPAAPPAATPTPTPAPGSAPAAPAAGTDAGAGFEPEPLASGALRARFYATRRGARVQTLRLRGLVTGSRVALTCQTPRRARVKCPFTVRRYPGAAMVRLAPAFRRRVLPVGTRITMRITSIGRRARVVGFTVERGRVVRSASR